MTRSEAWLFVREHYKMVLCTLDSFGFPHAAPVWYVVIGNKIYFRAQPYKKKISNILKKPQVAGVVEDGDKYTELRGVMIQGLTKIVDGDKILRKQVFSLLAEKYSDLRDTEKFPEKWQEKYGREHRVVVELTPTNVVSWDNRKWLDPALASKNLI
jgi:nitroimidazol reductase NimA-like FMN-containing flavoprotein (pyridoxamine 5'-phosphate oxidase superfamily)